MACDLESTELAACASGIGKIDSHTRLLQIIAQLSCEISAAGGGDGTCANLSGSGSPVGSVTPDFVGQFYTNTDDDSIWEATGLTSADWTQTQSSSLGVSWEPTSYALQDAFGYTNFNSTAIDFPGVTSITFKQASSLAGFVFQSMTTLQTVSFPNLTAISRRLQLSSNTALTTINAPVLQTINTGVALSLVVQSNPMLTSVSFPSLTNISTDLTISSNAALTTISMPVVTNIGMVNFPLGISSNTLLSTLTMPLLATLPGINTISLNPALTTVSLPALTSSGRFTISSNAALDSVSMPLLSAVSGGTASMDLSSNPVLTTVSLPLLAALGNMFSASSNTILTAISLPALTTVGAITHNSNPALLSISYPVLTTSGAITANGNTLLNTVSLPSLITLTATLTLTTDPALASLVLTNYVPTNGRVHTITGAALTDTSVNLLLARAVANGAYVTGTINTSGGTSSAPTGAGVADKATLIARGVTVTTN